MFLKTWLDIFLKSEGLQTKKKPVSHFYDVQFRKKENKIKVKKKSGRHRQESNPGFWLGSATLKPLQHLGIRT